MQSSLPVNTVNRVFPPRLLRVIIKGAASRMPPEKSAYLQVAEQRVGPEYVQGGQVK
jgi:hypothetical protein